MDVFDKYLFDEITQDYAQEDLSSEDYEEIYQRFLNLQHVPEVKPYLLAMKFLGYGIEADEESVLNELEECIKDNDIALFGLYYDCILFRKREDSEAAKRLSELIDKGYSDIYLKGNSYVSHSSHRKEYNKNFLLQVQRLVAVLEECYNKLLRG